MSGPQSNGNGSGPRVGAARSVLSPSEKYEIWISLIRGRVHDVQGLAAAKAEIARLTEALKEMGDNRRIRDQSSR